MDYFSKNKMLFWCVLILILLNVATLTALWVGRPPHGMFGRPGEGQQIMEERLNFSDEQAEKLKQIRENHFSLTVPIQDKMHEIRMKLLDEIFQPEPDSDKIKAMTAEIGKQQEQFETYLFQHFADLKGLCNANQTQELKTVLTELIEHTRPKNPQDRESQFSGPPGPPPPPHPQPDR